MDKVNFSELDYPAAKAFIEKLETELREQGKFLNNQPRYGNGLTPDSIKALPDWQIAKRKYNCAFIELQRFNKLFVKSFKIEIRQDRDAKREKLFYELREEDTPCLLISRDQNKI